MFVGEHRRSVSEHRLQHAEGRQGTPAACAGTVIRSSVFGHIWKPWTVLILQVDTYDDPRDSPGGPVYHRGYCQIKV